MLYLDQLFISTFHSTNLNLTIIKPNSISLSDYQLNTKTELTLVYNIINQVENYSIQLKFTNILTISEVDLIAIYINKNLISNFSIE